MNGPDSLQFGNKPQNAEHADKPGEYRLAPRVRQAQIDPGKEIVVELYITGYGRIQGPKLVFYPPPFFIDEQNSKAFFDLGESESSGRLVFGKTERQLSEAGLTVVLAAGIQAPGWAESSLFFDLGQGKATNQIATEAKQTKAPVELQLKTQAKAPAGNHTLQFYLTYFNGSEWKSDSQTVSIEVPNWWRRHEGWTFFAALVAVVITLASLVLDIADKWNLVEVLFSKFLQIPILGAGVIVFLCVGIPLILYRFNLLPVGHS